MILSCILRSKRIGNLFRLVLGCVRGIAKGQTITGCHRLPTLLERMHRFMGHQTVELAFAQATRFRAQVNVVAEGICTRADPLRGLVRSGSIVHPDPTEIVRKGLFEPSTQGLFEGRADSDAARCSKSVTGGAWPTD